MSARFNPPVIPSENLPVQDSPSCEYPGNKHQIRMAMHMDTILFIPVSSISIRIHGRRVGFVTSTIHKYGISIQY